MAEQSRGLGREGKGENDASLRQEDAHVLPARPQPPRLNLTPLSGERVLICGQTGSGKTVAMVVLAGQMGEGERVVVLDAKVEPRYRALPRSREIRKLSEAWAPEGKVERREGPAALIWRPDPLSAQDPAYLDSALYDLYQRFRGTIVIDELYPFHTGGRAGPGMTALLTRGRSRGLTTIMGSQRPTWISRFCLSESQHYWIYALVDRLDRQRVSGVIPNFPQDEPPPRYWFYYYSHLADLTGPVLFRPLRLKKNILAIDDEPLDNGVKWI